MSEPRANAASEIKSKSKIFLTTFAEMAGMFRRFKSYLAPQWALLVVGLIASMLLNSATLVQPYLLKILTDKVLMEKSKSMLILVTIAIIVSAFGKGIFTYLQGYLIALAGQKAIRKLRDDLYDHLQSLPISFFEKSRVGDLMIRVTTDVQNITDMMTRSLVNILNDCIILVFALGYMLYIDWKMTIIALMASPLIGVAITYFGNMLQNSAAFLLEKMSDIWSIIHENLSVIRLIKCFNREAHETAVFEEKNNGIYECSVRIVTIGIMQTPVVETLAMLGVAFVVLYGSMGVLSGRYTIGDMMAFWGYMILATNPLNRITSTIANLRVGMISAVRVAEIMDVPPEVSDKPNATNLPEIKGAVDFCNVCFSYEKEKPVLKCINFSCTPGEQIAIVGPNGAGKTTLANLIPRFYEAQEGDVSVNGHKVKDVKLSSLRKQIAIVPQDTVLFSGTLRDNIAYGRVNSTDEDIMEAARVANAHEFILALPQQYNTVVGERGVGLSGGQRQRISIARAVLRNPKILILDEATSSLDQESEAVVQEALERLMKNTTTFIIAHRLSSIKRADKILVINEGRIVESGVHDELIAKGGLYAALYNAQMMDNKDKAA